jgi:putative oligomerization/nucleic acid binding protein
MPMMRRRRPLLRAAAVGGGAYMAGKHRARREDEQAYAEEPAQEPAYAEPAPAAAPAPAAGGLAPDAIQRLQELGQLHDQGVLTDEEFTTQKARVLGT